MRLLELETDDVVKDPEGKCTEKNINMKRKQFKVIADVAINTHTYSTVNCSQFSGNEVSQRWEIFSLCSSDKLRRDRDEQMMSQILY